MAHEPNGWAIHSWWSKWEVAKQGRFIKRYYTCAVRTPTPLRTVVKKEATFSSVYVLLAQLKRTGRTDSNKIEFYLKYDPNRTDKDPSNRPFIKPFSFVSCIICRYPFKIRL